MCKTDQVIQINASVNYTGAHSIATTGNALYLPYREKKDLIEDLEVVFIAVLAENMMGGGGGGGEIC